MKHQFTFRSLSPFLLSALILGACSTNNGSNPGGSQAADTGADAAATTTSTPGSTSGGTHAGTGGADSAVPTASGSGNFPVASGVASAANNSDAGTSVTQDAASNTLSDAGTACATPSLVSLVPATHSSLQGQSFGETRALLVTPDGADVTVTGLVLNALNAGAAGTVGARIYDATSKALVASGDTTVAVGTNLSVEVALTATLVAGKTYRVAFYVDANGSAELFEATLPYAAGGLKVSGFFQASDDSYPENVNLYAPQISIKTCGSADTTSGDAGGDAGGSNTATACNQLELQGPRIGKTTNAGASPTLMGGTVYPGTYVLTTINKYNGTQGSNTHREKWVFGASSVEVVTENSEDDNEALHYSGSYAVSGNELTFTITCPEGAGALTGRYTATETQFQFQSEPNSSDQEIHVLTKQQ